MPCYEVRYVGVRLDLADRTTAAEAIREVGARRGIGLYLDQAGQVRVPQGQNADEIGNEVKQVYASKKIIEAGKKYNWKTTQKGQNRFEFVRR